MVVFMSMNLHSHTELSLINADQRDAMNRMYRLQRHVYDASRRYYLLGRDQLIADLNVPPGGTVLEAGCGTGRNLIMAAERYPQSRLFGFDISDEMLKCARAGIVRRGLGDRVRVAQGDALDFSAAEAFGIPVFDRIYFSYTLSMIPGWEAALRHACTMLAERGALHVADFGQFEALPAPLRRLMFAWLRQFQVSPRKALRSEFTALARALRGTAKFTAGHRGYDWHLALHAGR